MRSTSLVESAPTNPSSRIVPLAIAIALLVIVVFHGTALITHPDYYSDCSWDEAYYVEIADQGYSLRGDSYRNYSVIPFSPGYPYLLRAVAWLSGLTATNVRLPLSAILFVVGCVGLARLFAAVFGDKLRAGLALALTVSWPGSLYFLTGYAEALYFPLLAWFFVCLHQRLFLPAAILCAFALFTRSPAIVLPATLLVHATAVWLGAPSGARDSSWRLLARLSGYGAIASLGIVGYCLILNHQVDDPFEFLKAYDAWGGSAKDTGHTVFLMRTPFWSAVTLTEAPALPYGLCLFLLAPVVVVLTRRHMPLEFSLFAAIAWVFLLSHDNEFEPCIDIFRWSAVLFPVHVGVTLLLDRWTGGRSRWTAALGALLVLSFLTANAYFVSRHISWEWVS